MTLSESGSSRVQLSRLKSKLTTSPDYDISVVQCWNEFFKYIKRNDCLLAKGRYVSLPPSHSASHLHLITRPPHRTLPKHKLLEGFLTTFAINNISLVFLDLICRTSWLWRVSFTFVQLNFWIFLDNRNYG